MDKEFTEASPEDQQEMIDCYRKVEKETNDQIEQAGSVKKWYESGRGRLVNIKTFEGFMNESESFVPTVKKGEKIKVELSFFKGQPEYMMEAEDDSFYSEYSNCHCFSFRMGGDMMMIAKWDGKKWTTR